MDSDPYKPPDSSLTEQGETREKIYSPGQVALAAFLGSPIAGCWLMAKNYAVFGNHQAQRRTIVWGVLGTIALFGLAPLVPDAVPRPVVPLAITFASYQSARVLQLPVYELYLERGHLKHSSLRVAGIGIAWLVLILIVLMAVILLMPS